MIIDVIRDLDLTSDGHSIDERRSMMAADGVGAVDERTRVERVDARGVPCEWVTDVDAGPRTEGIVVHLHGGAYTLGGLATHRRFAGSLSELAGVPVLSVDYRVAPEAPFPAALDDATTAVRWAVDEQEHRPVGDRDQRRLGRRRASRCRRSWRDGTPGSLRWRAACCSHRGPTSRSRATRWRPRTAAIPCARRASLAPSAAAYLGDVPADDPRVSPLFADLAGLPPLLIHVGEVETLARRRRAPGGPGRGRRHGRRAVGGAGDDPRVAPVRGHHARVGPGAPEGRRRGSAVGWSSTSERRAVRPRGRRGRRAPARPCGRTTATDRR